MPRFTFQVQQGKFSETPAIEDLLCDSCAARKAALGICGDMAKDIANSLADDSEWRLDVLDESGKPVFRLRLLAESLHSAAQLPFAIGPV
jgi:Domain of unknown function (DUF6894)